MQINKNVLLMPTVKSEKFDHSHKLDCYIFAWWWSPFSTYRSLPF